MKKGIVYVLVNSAMPGIVKIGSTTRDLQERMRELSANTGIPVPFAEAYSAEFFDPGKTERQIHSALANFRYQENREFFQISVSEAIRKVQEFERNASASKRAFSNIMQYSSSPHNKFTPALRKSNTAFGQNFPRKENESISLSAEDGSVWTYGGIRKREPFSQEEMDEISASRKNSPSSTPIKPHARALCPRCRTAGWIWVEEKNQTCWHCKATRNTESWMIIEP